MLAKKEQCNDAADPAAFADRERERLHRQILSSVSHDLKTPLASIIGSLEVYELMKDRLTDDRKEALIAVALQEAYRLDNFITDILDMAKLESGMVKPRRESVFVGGLVQDCLTRLGHRLTETKVQVEPAPALIEAITDPSLLARAVCLLLDNAVKHGGKPALIWIAFGREEGDGLIHIRDNGPGIPTTQLETVFSKYTRLDREDRQNAGTGLGLAICREIMRLLNGSVTVAAASGGGMVFTLRYPLA